jgi:hypothetical protein
MQQIAGRQWERKPFRLYDDAFSRLATYKLTHNLLTTSSTVRFGSIYEIDASRIQLVPCISYRW